MFSILCFGDSVVYGRGETPSKGWVGRLKEDFEKDSNFKAVYNLGIAGDTSYSLQKRIRFESLPRIWRRNSHDKYVAIIGIGGNDAKEIISEGNTTTHREDFTKNIMNCIDEIYDIFDEIVLIGIGQVNESKTRPFVKNVYFSNDLLLEYNDLLRDVANQKNCYFCDIQDFVHQQENYPSLLEDGVHPNSQGYDALYTYIKKFLDEHQLLKN